MNASDFSEPFTPRGVAVFARVKWNRLFVVQLIFAAVAAATVACSVYDDCFPTIQAAIEALPADGQIHSGRLEWSDTPQMLAEGHFLAIDVDPGHSSQLRSTADLQAEFGSSSIRFYSLFGYMDLFYPPDETMPFNHPELEPLWSAWRDEILFFIAAITFVALLATWWILATLYFLPIWLLGFYTNRDISLSASWKMSCAALFPGALLMIGGLLLYNFGFLSLVSFCFVFAAHFVLDWLYLVFGLIFFPRTSTAPAKGNPFKPGRKQKT